MKRSFCLIFSIVLLLSLCGCAKSAEDFEKPASFYYRTDPIIYFSDHSVLAPEIRETADFCDNALDIVNCYLNGPKSDSFVSPFPSGTAALSLVRQDNTMVITLNEPFSSLTGLDLSIACAGIAMTLIHLTGCEIVEICAKDNLLDGSTAITIHADSLYTLDTSIVSD